MQNIVIFLWYYTILQTYLFYGDIVKIMHGRW